MKVRQGNDFKLIWRLMADETTPRDMTGVFDEQVQLLSPKGSMAVSYTRVGHELIFEFTPAICTILGSYSIEYHFKEPHPNFPNGRNRAVDTPAFSIVPHTAQADDIQTINILTIFI